MKKLVLRGLMIHHPLSAGVSPVEHRSDDSDGPEHPPRARSSRAATAVGLAATLTWLCVFYLPAVLIVATGGITFHVIRMMVGASGIEPPTTTMSRWCSTTELRA
jgi:hypothetical protein